MSRVSAAVMSAYLCTIYFHRGMFLLRQPPRNLFSRPRSVSLVEPNAAQVN